MISSNLARPIATVVAAILSLVTSLTCVLFVLGVYFPAALLVATLSTVVVLALLVLLDRAMRD